jgi:hypothetical protein
MIRSLTLAHAAHPRSAIDRSGRGFLCWITAPSGQGFAARAGRAVVKDRMCQTQPVIVTPTG